MSFLSKRDVLASIKRREQNQNGNHYTTYEAYFGVNPLTKKAVRKYAKSMNAIKDIVNAFYDTLDHCGAEATTLTPHQANDAKTALGMLARANLKMTLQECVEWVLEGRALDKSISCMTIGEAFDKYVEATQDKSADYKRDIRSRVGGWAEATGKDTPLSEVNAAGIKTYLMEKYYKSGDVGTWTTYNNALGNIKSFLNWCSDIEQGFCKENPASAMKKLVIPYRQPEYMKADDVQKLFTALWERKGKGYGSVDLAYMILFCFCGMRMSEIERARLGDEAIKINLEERFIRIELPKGVSKGIRPRTFIIPDQALAWMKSFNFMESIRQPNSHLRRRITSICTSIGIPTPKNMGRHTFITMFEAVHHDANALTAIVGNSDDVRAKCYNGVELSTEGRKFFAIMPPTI